MNKLITIVTVVYNAKSTIERTICSVLSQNFKELQYIIIDGQSTDGTMEIINKYHDFISVCVSEKDEGVYDAMNKSLQYVKGDWILFMNAGDTFFSDTSLSSLFLNGIPNDISVLYGDSQYRYPYGDLFVKARNIDTIRKSMPFCHQSVLVKAELFKKFPFNLNYKYAADYDFFYKLYKLGYKFLYRPICISIYSLYNGLTDSHTLDLYREIFSIRGDNRSVIANPRLIFLAIKDSLPTNLKYLIQRMLYKIRRINHEN